MTNRKALLIAFGLVVAYLGANFFDVWWTSNATYLGEAEAAIVLGAAQYNGDPSGALKGRLDTAASLYTDERVAVVVVTGGGQETDTTTEAKAGYDYLRAAGVPDKDLRLEVQGTSTYESIAAAARFLKGEEIADVVVVTDSYHARRAELVAAEVGLNPEAATTSAQAPLDRLLTETVAVSVGRVSTFRRLDNWLKG